jgi:hypothetical protein
MLYNYLLQFNEECESIHENVCSNCLSILSKTAFDLKDFPFELIYQNNQDRNVILATDREFDQPADDQKWLFSVENVISYTWQSNSHEMFYTFHEGATDEIFKFWLYHIVLPIKLSIEQVYKFLHAGAVEIDENAVLFMAPSFGGKSTLTDYFLQRGHPLITDDKMATFEKDGEYYAVPSHPYHRPFRTVEVLGHLCENPATQIRPIHAIYILAKAEADAPIVIRRLKGVEKFSRLHEGGEMNFSFFTPQYVAYLAGLANRIKVYEIIVPHDMERLEEVYQSIKEHTNSIDKDTNDTANTL